jgi:hypothetical protein
MYFRRFFCSVAVLALVLSFGNSSWANNNNNNNNNNNATDAGAGGVEIDPQGVLRVLQSDPRLTFQRLRAAKQSLPQQLAQPSKMRKVSLNRLEAAIASKLQAGKPLDQEMVALAGLTRLEYVFFYPESGDIVFAGPAEGFARDSNGRLVGVDTARPCLLLEDLAVALRAFPPQGTTSNTISVSIDPTQEGLARMQKTLQQLGSISSMDEVPGIVNALRQSLGLNDVTLTGVPRTTHFAHVLTEADYRMKLIGIGLETPPVPLVTYISRLAAAPANALIRWYFVPDYESVACSPDGHAMQLVGRGLKLIGADEMVNSDGTRRDSGRSSNPASKAFTTDFTKKFEAIADSSLIYGQLRNLVDLTIAAAYVQDRKFYSQSGWDQGVLGSEDQLSVEVLPAPMQVETAINAVVKGSRLITPIGGGVLIQAKQALKAENIQEDKDGSIAKAHAAQNLNAIPATSWWWD